MVERVLKKNVLSSLGDKDDHLYEKLKALENEIWSLSLVRQSESSVTDIRTIRRTKRLESRIRKGPACFGPVKPEPLNKTKNPEPEQRKNPEPQNYYAPPQPCRQIYKYANMLKRPGEISRTIMYNQN